MNMTHLTLAVCAAFALSACGGSGGGSSPNTGSTEKPTQGQSSLSGVPKEHQAAVKGAKDFAPYEDYDLTFNKLTIDGKTVLKNEKIDFSSLKDGFTDKKVTLDYKDENGNKGKAEGVMKIYQQPYSMVIGTLITKDSFDPEEVGRLTTDHIRGLATAVNALPTEGKFTYNGAALSNNEQGKLSYTVDFAARTGGGSITGLNQMGTVTLHQSGITRDIDADIGNIGISGNMSASKHPKERGDYELGFFGPKAEEIAGEAGFDKDALSDIIFAGKR